MTCTVRELLSKEEWCGRGHNIITRYFRSDNGVTKVGSSTQPSPAQQTDLRRASSAATGRGGWNTAGSLSNISRISASGKLDWKESFKRRQMTS